MSAFRELAIQCDRRGWRLCLCGTYPNGKDGVGFVVNNLAVRTHPRSERALLATVGAEANALDQAACDLARSLQYQGLIT